MSIFFPSLPPKICWVPRAEATQLNSRSRGGSTERGVCSAPRSRLALSLLKSLLEMRLAPSLGLTLWVLSQSLFSPGRGSLALGGEPSTTAYGGGLALQIMRFLYHCKDGSSPNSGGMGGKNWGLQLLLIGSFWLLLRGHWVLLPDWGLHSGVGGRQTETHWRVSCSGERRSADSSHTRRRSQN